MIRWLKNTWITWELFHWIETLWTISRETELIQKQSSSTIFKLSSYIIISIPQKPSDGSKTSPARVVPWAPTPNASASRQTPKQRGRRSYVAVFWDGFGCRLLFIMDKAFQRLDNFVIFDFCCLLSLNQVNEIVIWFGVCIYFLGLPNLSSRTVESTVKVFVGFLRQELLGKFEPADTFEAEQNLQQMI